MGLNSKGTIATLWNVKPDEKFTKAQISISKKNPETNNWEQDFNGFARFIGRAHNVVKGLGDKDKIKITEFDITNKYDKDKKITYWNTTVWDCEIFQKPSDENPF